MAKWDRRVPFKDGSLKSYHVYMSEQETEWRDNYEVDLTLTFKEFERGRSRANAIFEDQAGNTYPMFLSDLGDVLPLGLKQGGTISGRWTFTKKGQNFGIKIITRTLATSDPQTADDTLTSRRR